MGALVARVRGLYSAHLDRVRTFWAVSDFKAYLVSLAQFVETNVDELVGVEKEIFFASFDRDEPETLVGQSGDSSFLHFRKNRAVKSSQYAEGGGRPLRTWVS